MIAADDEGDRADARHFGDHRADMIEPPVGRHIVGRQVAIVRDRQDEARIDPAIGVRADQPIHAAQRHRRMFGIAPARREIERHADEGDLDLASDQILLADRDGRVGEGRDAALLELIAFQAERPIVAFQLVEHLGANGGARIPSARLRVERDFRRITPGFELAVLDHRHQRGSIGIDISGAAPGERDLELLRCQAKARQHHGVGQKGLLFRRQGRERVAGLCMGRAAQGCDRQGSGGAPRQQGGACHQFFFP